MLLDRSQIERWAESFPAQGDFPQLIKRLVYASTPGLVKCNIPFGSAVNMGGVDGIQETACQALHSQSLHQHIFL